MELKCYLAANGFRRFEASDLHPLIATYLEQDVQGLASCNEVISIVDEIVVGKRGHWEETGNAHVVTVGSRGVSICNLWDDSLGEAHEIPLDVFRQCLVAWRDFWQRPALTAFGKKAPV